ncbi:MAG: outer membrane beta-barrel protein [Chromatiales bacterium]|nr:MAG: outer membrane beta-barrel protein [Chromatiales bacterium]
MKATALLLVALAFVAQPAFSQSADNPLDTRIFKNGLWFGAGGNWSFVDPDFSGADDDDDIGFSATVGWQFANYFGVNARYKDLGEFSVSDVPGVDVDVEVDGFTVGLNAGYPITGRIAVIGGLGYYTFDTEYDVSVSGPAVPPGFSISETDDEDGLYASIGGATQIGRIIISPEFVWYDTDDADLYSFEINFFWKTEIGN